LKGDREIDGTKGERGGGPGSASGRMKPIGKRAGKREEAEGQGKTHTRFRGASEYIENCIEHRAGKSFHNTTKACKAQMRPRRVASATNQGENGSKKGNTSCFRPSQQQHEKGKKKK